MTGLAILDLLGGVALLLWGLHMVQSGVLRAFGPELRRFLAATLRNRVSAFLMGAGITAALQSSTATALMATSFTASGLVALVPALAVMLGANVGTTLVVQLLSFDVAKAAPVLLILGVVAFRQGARTRTRDLGRVAIGLGLMLLSLHILMDSLAPAEIAPGLRAAIAPLTSSLWLTLVLGAALAWAAHSSVAVVVLTMSLAYSQFVTPVAALALVLGANLGSAINPFFEGATADPASRRLPLGNLITRIVGCALVLPFLPEIAGVFQHIDPNAARFAADFHTLFNLGVAALFILPLDGLALLLVRLLPERKPAADPSAPLYLDESAVGSPSVALVCAAREVLHMGDLVEAMLRQAMAALMTNDRKLVAEVSRMDDGVDRLHEAIKLYVVTKVMHDPLEESEGQRAMEIIGATINLEHIGDIIDKNLMELAQKKIKKRLAFSAEGAAELAAIHRRVVESLKLAFGVFIGGDVRIARQLLAEKAEFRSADFAASESHLGRLREGRIESIESSSLHLDVLRDLKRIHSHLCSFAYPVLERAGELQPTRLKQTAGEASDVAGLGNPSH
ncbi:MAG TPA: Na/Pi cotransporter family protein [Stellaceae bacterium]|nr:Na/Pi cotransporter family protein [Stellaceae bacterium]